MVILQCIRYLFLFLWHAYLANKNILDFLGYPKVVSIALVTYGFFLCLLVLAFDLV